MLAGTGLVKVNTAANSCSRANNVEIIQMVQRLCSSVLSQ